MRVGRDGFVQPGEASELALRGTLFFRLRRGDVPLNRAEPFSDEMHKSYLFNAGLRPAMSCLLDGYTDVDTVLFVVSVRCLVSLGHHVKRPRNCLRLGLGIVGRSEERRVGKECRSRWSPYH